MLAIAYVVRPSTEVHAPAEHTDKPAITEETITDMQGVIESVASDGAFFTLILPEGGMEEVIVPEEDPVSPDQIGLVATVSGVRDLATRRISADSVQIEQEQNIYVTSPKPGSVVTSPLVVAGFARVFEQTLSWRLLDKNGTVLREGIAMTQARDIGMYGPFRFDVFLPVFEGGDFTLEVFTYSPRDGSIQDLVSIPLSLLDQQTTSFHIFFPHNTDSNSCSAVFGAPRVVANTSATGRAALLELLAGPSVEEEREGYETALPANLTLNTLAITNGEARADFSAELADIANACEKEKALAQISQTLLQFDMISSVVISSEGEILGEFD